MKVIAIGGQPATGKSTLMNAFIDSLGREHWVDDKPIDLLYGHRNEFIQFSMDDTDDTSSKEFNIFIAGRYINLTEEEEKFPGTDRLSMAVMPEFKKYIEQNKERDEVVVFEGDRLFSHNLLNWLVDEIGEENVHIILLDVDQSNVDQRHIDRNDTQTEQFIKSRQTKYESISSDFYLADLIENLKHNNEDDTKSIVNRMLEIVG